MSGDFGSGTPAAEDAVDASSPTEPEEHRQDPPVESITELIDAFEIDDLESSVSSAERERDEYLDSLRRLQAEFDNFRKRTARQQSEILDRATEALLERLLPVLDALDLAVAHLGPESAGDVDGEVAAGHASDGTVVRQIGTMLQDILAKEGLERIDARDVAFDPTIHDAVAHVAGEPEDSEGSHLIDDVLRAGYQLRGRVLRPAMVRVRG